MNMLIAFICGLVLGGLIVWLWFHFHKKKAQEIARELYEQAQNDKARELELMLNQVKDAFGSLSIDALRKSTDEFLKLAHKTLHDQSKMNDQQLDQKKQLIDQTLKNMKGELGKVEDLLQKVEKDRRESYGQLAEQLRQSAEQTRRLQESTSRLNTALTHSQMRGQWGERMAEDVLRMAGFIEGINYLKQKSIEGGQSRPDFTFLLPHNLKVNMDVKFPLTNYLYYLEAEGKTDKEHYKNQFLRDVRKRLKEVTNRDYINPADNTVDYVIAFIPNEQVYSFINEQDRGIMDEALRNKVILSSPVTLYAILAIIRQAVDNFNLEKTAAQILNLLAEFNKQWANFKTGMEKMGKRIEDARNEYQKLVSTRTKKLERPLQQMEDVRQHHFLETGEKSEAIKKLPPETDYEE